MKIKKTLAITSVAGGSNGVLSDALNISVNKEVTINGDVSQKVFTIGTDNSDNAKVVAAAAATTRSIVYMKNKSTTSNNIKIYNDALNDGDTDLTDGTAADSTGSAFELIMELAKDEFAIFPASLDFPLIAVAASSGALLEVAIFAEA